MGFLSGHSSLMLRVFHPDGSIEQVIVHPMSLGSGAEDLISMPGLPAGFGTIERDLRGRHHLQVGKKGAMILVGERQEPTSRVTLEPGVNFRLAGHSFECVGVKSPEPEAVGTWKSGTRGAPYRRSPHRGMAGLFGLALVLVVVGMLGRHGPDIAMSSRAGSGAKPEDRGDPVGAAAGETPDPDGADKRASRSGAPQGDDWETIVRLAGQAQPEAEPAREASGADDGAARGEMDGLRAAALAGDPEALFRLGDLHARGDGVARDPGEAVAHYRKASALGHSRATYALGQCLEFGIGTVRNEREAYLCYSMAAKAGLAEAAFRAGVMSENGRGTGQDDEQAFRCYQEGAERGSVEAMVNLGLMWAQGRGCVKDESKALECYREAATAGDKDGMVLLGMMHEFGIGTGRDRALAAAQYRKAAELGDSEAAYYLELLGESP